MPIPVSQSTFYVPMPSLDGLKPKLQAKMPTTITTTKNSSHDFTISNLPKNPASGKRGSPDKHVRSQNPIESGATPPPLPPRAPRINNPATHAFPPPPVFSKDMSDEALKTILKKPGQFQFDTAGDTPHLIHHSANGSIVRTPVQTDQNGRLHVYKEGWSIVNDARPANLEDLAQGLQLIQKMKLVDLPGSSIR